MSTEAASSRGVVLIVDDDPDLRTLYRLTLSGAGYECLEAGSGSETRELLAETAGGVDAIILDVALGPHESGLDLIQELRGQHPDLPVLMSTASRAFEHAVQALKSGAFDYLVKPVSREDLLLSVRNAVDHKQMRRELSVRRSLHKAVPWNAADMVVASPAMRALLEIVDQVAGSSVPVMVLGETGTGKELIARRLHQRSKRRSAPFIGVNCASLPRELAESELFGHDKGTFTGAVRKQTGRFEEAGEGTIFLDEIGELDLQIQAKLLRVLQEAEITAIGGRTTPFRGRVVVATHRRLEDEVAAGRFREDLYYRLNVIMLRLPPLRERAEEIPLLASHLLSRFVRADSLPDKTLDPSALEALELRSWPGNIRELENVLKRAALLSKGPLINLEDLGLSPETTPSLPPPRPSAAPEAVRPIQDYEPELLLRAIAETHGNVSEACRRLGIGRSTFYRKVRRYGISL
ncbi:MAG: sigma-54 dependent transcriptional regulator [Myxococcota bacterium]